MSRALAAATVLGVGLTPGNYLRADLPPGAEFTPDQPPRALPSGWAHDPLLKAALAAPMLTDPDLAPLDRRYQAIEPGEPGGVTPLNAAPPSRGSPRGR